MKIRKLLGQLLIGSRAYKPIRFVYQAVFDRPAIQRRMWRRALYSQIISRDDLVFDVGANLGNYTEAFCALGARVVAIEPDPRNIEVLRQRLKHEPVLIEACALGREETTAELQMFDVREVSSLSSDSVETTQAKWQGKVSVKVRTLDSLAAQHGTPRYVKVDAEGFDHEILSGMSFDPAYVSFEFQPADLTVANKCIDLFKKRSFNFVIGERGKFELASWVSAAEIADILAAIPSTTLYGDVFAR